jgi:hypothetical protein
VIWKDELRIRITCGTLSSSVGFQELYTKFKLSLSDNGDPGLFVVNDVVCRLRGSDFGAIFVGYESLYSFSINFLEICIKIKISLINNKPVFRSPQSAKFACI